MKLDVLLPAVVKTGPMGWFFVVMLFATPIVSLGVAYASSRRWGRLSERFSQWAALAPLASLVLTLFGAVMAYEAIAKAMVVGMTTPDLAQSAKFTILATDGFLYMGVLANVAMALLSVAAMVAAGLPLLAREPDSTKAPIGLLYLPAAALAVAGLASGALIMRMLSLMLIAFGGLGSAAPAERTPHLNRAVEEALPLLGRATAYHQEWAILAVVVGAAVAVVLARGGRIVGRRELVAAGAVFLMGVFSVGWEAHVADILPTIAEARGWSQLAGVRP